MSTLRIQPKLPAYDPKEALQLYLSGRHKELCQLFASRWQFLKENTLYHIEPSTQHFIDTFVQSFLYLYTQPDLSIPAEMLVIFVNHNRIISNIVACSCVKTTDVALEYLRHQQWNFVKILSLYSARNSIHFDRKAIFDLDPKLGSLWYLHYGSLTYSALGSPLVIENLRQHFHFTHPNLEFPGDAQDLYFGATYVDGKCDREIKPRINQHLRKSGDALPPIVNKPDPRKIAVFSTAWVGTHSVFRILYAYVKALRPKYHVTFFQLGRYGVQDTTHFDESHTLELYGGSPPDLSKILNNQFQVVYFPDVGMCLESIFLANRRIAPIQLCGLGHSVSTYGSDIDYYVSGVDCEQPGAHEQNYSERLVLLPGMGAIHNRPLYKPPAVPPKKKTDKFIINLLTFAQKVNYSYLMTLKKLMAASKRPLHFRFFVGVSSAKYNDHMPFYRELVNQLGAENFELFGHLIYQSYMSMAQEGDLTIDSFHFGGCNTVSDSLYIGVPIVTWEGSKWYNRIGSQMLRLVNLHDCIATTEQEYLDITLRLIHDDEARQDVRRRIAAANLDTTIYSTEEARYFVKAIDHLIANHERLKADPDRSPIVIPRD